MIEVELSAAEVSIEPGGTAQLTVTVTNRQPHDDHVFLEIEGVDVEWYALPVPALNIAAGSCQSARVLFKIARSSGSRAETYPFLVRARGMESGAAGVQQATLLVKPFSALQVEVHPKRATSTVFHHVADVEVSISNLGNHDETLDLFASDPEDACAYEFEPERVTVKPGHSEAVPVHIEPKTRPMLGAARLYGYTVTARSVHDTFVSGTAHGQLERRALLSPLTAILVVVLALATSAGFYFRPRQIFIRAFTVAPTAVQAGDQVTISWKVDNATEVYIQPENVRRTEPMGSLKVPVDQTTTFSLVARAGSREKQSQAVTVTVAPRPTPPKPRIMAFTATQSKIHQGETVTLSWKVENATGIVLNPEGPDVHDPLVYVSKNVTPDRTTTYILKALGAGKNVATQSLTVHVVLPTESIAEITAFRARPEKIVAGQSATLAWKVENASSIEISPVVGPNLKPQDRFKVSPVATTTYTLTAKDNKGNPVTKSVAVTVTQPPPPQNPENPALNNPNLPGGNTSPPGTPPPSGTGH